MPAKKGEIAQWIAAHIAAPPTDDCVFWPFYRDRDSGYAKMHLPGTRRAVNAHRYIWEVAYGRSFPDAVARHSCGAGNVGCVNWQHVAPGSHADNYADRVMLGEEPIGSERHNAILDELKVVEICRLLAGGRSMNSVAIEYGVSGTAIEAIWHGRTWQHVAAPRLGDVVTAKPCKGCGAKISYVKGRWRVFCSIPCQRRYHNDRQSTAARERRRRVHA